MILTQPLRFVSVLATFVIFSVYTFTSVLPPKTKNSTQDTKTRAPSDTVPFIYHVAFNWSVFSNRQTKIRQLFPFLLARMVARIK